jgi:hypothetical protein
MHTHALVLEQEALPSEPPSPLFNHSALPPSSPRRTHFRAPLPCLRHTTHHSYLLPPPSPSQLSSAHVLTTEWMQGLPMDQAGAPGVLPPAERDRIGERLLWLTLCELFSFRLMQVHAQG